MISEQPITMKDIARHFGVSIATVSRALADQQNISQKRREEIQRYAREHNFTANTLARDLRNTKVSPVKIIGVIVPEMIHYYFASVLDGIESEARRLGYGILVAQSHEQYEEEVSICKSFYENRVCGIIISLAKETQRYEHFTSLQQHGVPLVFYDRISHVINASRVVVDDYQGAVSAVTHLVESGCRRIAFFGSPMHMEISKNRYNGYKDTLLRYGLPIDESLIRICDNSEDAARIAPAMLSDANRPDAFFAINDDTAIGILKSAKSLGLRVPEDVSICGFSDGFRARASDPQLTTVNQRGQEVGREAVNILIKEVEGVLPIDKVNKRIVRTRLIVRGTTR